LNDADRLRAAIAEAERLTARLDATTSRDAVLAVDRAEQMIAALTAGGTDLRAERARIDALQNMMTRNAGRVVRALGGPLGFQRLRRELCGDIALPVWQLDRRVNEGRRRRLRNIGIVVMLMLAGGLAAYLARDILLPPDPVGDALVSARAAYADGDSDRALAALDLGLAQVPTSTQLLIWKGVLLENDGDPGAEAWYARARSGAPQTRFLFERAMVHVELQDADAVLSDANALIALEPAMPEGYFVRASGHEFKGDIPAALADLERAAKLADAQGNAPLYAAAKVRAGGLMR
jgi:tetratricopeptide (TPR) repeat protein